MIVVVVVVTARHGQFGRLRACVSVVVVGGGGGGGGGVGGGGGGGVGGGGGGGGGVWLRLVAVQGSRAVLGLCFVFVLLCLLLGGKER